MAAGPVLTLRELNRATLARQLLLERRRLPAASAVARLAGLQAQWPPAPYVGLWSRLEGFRRQALERALLRRQVVKASTMRGTLHLVAASEYALVATALRGMRSWPDEAAIAEAARIHPEIRALAGKGVLALRDALDHLDRAHGIADPVRANRVLFAARLAAHVHHAPETALWTTRPQALFVALPEPDGLGVEEARAGLVRRYLAAFGPATAADAARWSGLRVSEIAAALERLGPLRRLRDVEGRELVDLPRAPLPPAETRAPVRFLPKWDGLLLAHADRTRVLPEPYRKLVFAANGDVAQTFLVDGFVAGTWRVEDGRVRVEPFAPLPPAILAELDDEAARLAAFVG